MRPDHQVIAGCITRRAGADVAVHKRVSVDQLDRIIALGVNRRDRDDHGLRAQVEPEHRIGRVAVGRHDGRILPRERAGLVGDGVEGALVLAGVLVDAELVLRAVVHHERQPIDVAESRDVLGGEETGTALRERHVLCEGNGKGRRACGRQKITPAKHRNSFLLVGPCPSYTRASCA